MSGMDIQEENHDQKSQHFSLDGKRGYFKDLVVLSPTATAIIWQNDQF